MRFYATITLEQTDCHRIIGDELDQAIEDHINDADLFGWAITRAVVDRTAPDMNTNKEKARLLYTIIQHNTDLTEWDTNFLLNIADEMGK